ncbi:MAG: hypothetical protein MUC89_17310 [Acetobacteraceae bacterium]|jgi:hypothetical protein|nr:hypothetical protein [Acetobacteraceae bacterium]
MPAQQRLGLLRDALGMLDPKRHPGVRAETAAMLCETLLAEGARANARQMIAEAARVAASTIVTGPLPAGPRAALISALHDAVTLLAGAGKPERSLRRTGRGTLC